MTLEVTVQTRAYPQGSKRHVGNGRMVEAAGMNLKRYRAEIKHAAASCTTTLDDGPVAVACTFTFRRPSAHYDAKGRHKPTATMYPHPAKRGDIDKLVRATLDAITGAWIVDDAQVVDLYAGVRWGVLDEVTIAMETLRNVEEEWQTVLSL